GRNHGLTMRKLRNVLEDAAAQPVGRIHLNNNYTVVGLREDRWDEVIAALGERTVNGVALAPREATRGENRGEDPRFFNREARRR
ncbi:MAG: DbpA RNA binding domain-containing protein, partial [Planctomycetota bacterium]